MKNLAKNKTFLSIAPSVISILIGFAIGFLVLLVSNPAYAGRGFLTLLSGGFTGGMKGIGNVFYTATPIILTGLSVGFAFRTGLFNIGASGQFIIGAFTAVFIGVKWTFLPPEIHWIVALLGAAIALAPFAQVLKLYQSVAERYTYAASIGIVLAIVAILAAVMSKLRWPAWSAVSVLAVWMALSFMPLRERIHAWSSESELYYTSLIASPKSAVLHLNLGVLSDEEGNVESAATYYQTAIRLRPSYLQAHINLANLYLTSGRLDDAATQYHQVLAYDPENLGAQLKLAQLLSMKGDYDSALSLLMRLAQEYPDSHEVETGLGIVLYQRKDPAARHHFEKALEMKPDSANAAYNLAILEEKSGNLDAARKLYQQVLRHHPSEVAAAQALKRLR